MLPEVVLSSWPWWIPWKGQPVAYDHTLHNALCPLPMHSLLSMTNPYPSLVPPQDLCTQREGGREGGRKKEGERGGRDKGIEQCICVYIYIYIYTHTHTHTMILT